MSQLQPHAWVEDPSMRRIEGYSPGTIRRSATLRPKTHLPVTIRQKAPPLVEQTTVDVMRRLHSQLESRLSKLERAVSPEAIHEVRTGARRIQSILNAFRQRHRTAAFKSYRRELHRVITALNSIRDADVRQEALRSMTEDARDGFARNTVDKSKKFRLLAVYALESTLKSPLWACRMVRLQAASTELFFEGDGLRPFDATKPRDHIHFRKSLKKAFRYQGHSPGKLHHVRGKIRLLRYWIEWDGFNDGAVAQSDMKTLHQLQDCLGQLQDAFLLKKFLDVERRRDWSIETLCFTVAVQQRHLLKTYNKLRKRLLRTFACNS